MQVEHDAIGPADRQQIEKHLAGGGGHHLEIRPDDQPPDGLAN
jgi:hypothetical protein